MNPINLKWKALDKGERTKRKDKDERKGKRKERSKNRKEEHTNIRKQIILVYVLRCFVGSARSDASAWHKFIVKKVMEATERRTLLCWKMLLMLSRSPVPTWTSTNCGIDCSDMPLISIVFPILNDFSPLMCLETKWTLNSQLVMDQNWGTKMINFGEFVGAVL